MRALTSCENPVQQAYNGGDQINVRVLRDFHSTVTGNFAVIEAELRAHEVKYSAMVGKVNACYDFIDWVQKHAPETLTAYKAHNTVTAAFDKAEKPDEWMYPQAETSA